MDEALGQTNASFTSAGAALGGRSPPFNTHTLPLGNLMADAIRAAIQSDVALNAAGMVRAGLLRENAGVLTAYDVFLQAPLGIGVNDQCDTVFRDQVVASDHGLLKEPTQKERPRSHDS